MNTSALELLRMARCPNTECVDGGYYGPRGEAIQCQWCAERAAALSHAAGQEVVAWILRTGHGTALHEGARPPVEGVGWRPLVIAPAVARSEGEN